jgi:uncharacterized membrane protein YgcG
MTHRFDHELDKLTLQYLEKLRCQVFRDETAAMEGRAKFVYQVKGRAGQPVSKQPGNRLIGWMFISDLFQRKERSPMFATFGTLMIVLALLFGGAGVTVQAAQDSLPSEALYPVKTYSEQVQLALTTRTQARIQLLLHFSDQRVEEMMDLLAEGKPIPPETMSHLEQHYRLALRTAAHLDVPAMNKAHQQIDAQMLLQEMRLKGASDGPPGEVTRMLERVREMLQQQLHQVGEGVEDPLNLHLQVGIPTASETPVPDGERNGALSGPKECPNCTPILDGTGPGPGPLGTPVCDDCTPALDGTGPGPGPQNQGGTSQPGGQATESPGTGGDTSGGGSTTGGTDDTGGNDNGQPGSSGGGSGGGSNRP